MIMITISTPSVDDIMRELEVVAWDPEGADAAPPPSNATPSVGLTGCGGVVVRPTHHDHARQWWCGDGFVV